jgi:cyclophilin family peptidyl-prolyl cis-trans isomerase
MTADGKVASWGNFCTGVLGMARAGDPDSANSQFFFMRQHYASLDKTYTAFGRALTGRGGRAHDQDRRARAGSAGQDAERQACCPTCRPTSVPRSR